MPKGKHYSLNKANTPWLVYFLSKLTAEDSEEDNRKSHSQLGFRWFREVTQSNTEVIAHLGNKMLPQITCKFWSLFIQVVCCHVMETTCTFSPLQVFLLRR